jgi:diguanylate cyclase (GGDEF)-like protein
MTFLKSLQRKYVHGGLVQRIVVLSVLLLLGIQFTVQVIVRNSIEASVRKNLQTALTSDARVWGRLVEQNAQQLQLGASLLAADFGFRSAVSSADAETIQSALENNGARIGATVAALMDTRFALIATAKSNEGQLPANLLTEFSQSMAGTGQQGRMAMVQGRLHQFVLVPVRAPVVVGWVLMGFAVDKSLTTDMVALSSAQVMIVDDSKPSPELIYASLPEVKQADLAEIDLVSGAFSVADDNFAALRVPIDGRAQGLSAVLLRSTAEAKRVFDRMKWILLSVDVVGLLVFAVVISVLGSRVSKPLDLLVEDTERIGRGDYSHAVADFGRQDEVGNLARSFDRMRINIQAGQQEIRQLAYWDRLTELPNRAQFREALQSKLLSENSSQLAVVMLDLDRFKHINDVLGYAAGDMVLRSVSNRLRHLADSAKCLVARMGGGQFALLLPDSDANAAQLFAKRVAGALESPVSLEGQAVDISAGIGIVCWPQHAKQVDELLGRAEVAMYAAKRKNLGVLVYEANLDSTSAQNLTLLSELRHAIDGNELRLFLQPKIDLKTNAVSAAEALVRWEHPVRGMVQPMQFIPFAEQTGFIRFLTLWILDEAARQWQSLQPPHGALRIAINLSTRDLMDVEFPSKIDAILARYGVPRSGFCLEITESAIMDDPQRAEATLDQLSANGFKLSIDDFGTGYSSLAYLKSLPVNELKIDKSFVMGMQHDVSDAKIVRSTIDLAHNLGLTVVAEGVENAQIYQQLAELQCDEAQGYFMSKPMPASDFPAWRDRWESAHS